MSKDNVNLIETEFIQTWEEKEQRKKREFMDDIINEKEILEKTMFFHLDIEDHNISTLSSMNQEFFLENKSGLKKSIVENNSKLSDLLK